MARNNKYEVFVEHRLAEIETWRNRGETVEQICIRLNINIKTFYKYMKLYPELTKVMEKSKMLLINKLSKSLYKEAIGYPYQEITRERINGELKVTKEVTKWARGQVNAAMFLLCNLEPDFWKRVDRDINISLGDEVKKEFTNDRIEKAYNVLYNITEEDKKKVEKQINILENHE